MSDVKPCPWHEQSAGDLAETGVPEEDVAAYLAVMARTCRDCQEPTP